MQAGVPCTDACRCTGCQNCKGQAAKGPNPPENGPASKAPRLNSQASASDLRPEPSAHSDDRAASDGHRVSMSFERQPSLKGPKSAGSRPSGPSRPLPPHPAPPGFHYVMQPMDEPEMPIERQPASSRPMKPTPQGPITFMSRCALCPISTCIVSAASFSCSGGLTAPVKAPHVVQQNAAA